MSLRIFVKVGFVLLIAVCGAVTLRLVSAEIHHPLAITKQQTFDVQTGDGLIRVLETLEQNDLIRSSLLARAALRLNGRSIVIKPGEYRLLRGDTLLEFLMRLDKNESVVYPITIPEGVTFDWMLNRIWNHPQITRVLKSANDPRIKALILPFHSAEGLFLPETYLIQRGATDLSVLVQARQAMQAELTEVWRNRVQDLPLKTPYEALILASIVEKETGKASERPQIAGVFTKRLQLGMRLQTDPTIIYGLGNNFDGNLTRKHLRDGDNPYNTYRIDGLPPTPIALPGSEAIRASVSPKSGDALYFVAKGDGSHVFSQSLEEHERNVRRFQLRRVPNYRSSPTQ